MTKEAEYFAKVKYIPKYLIGDRVRGWWNNIPFAGSVLLDTLVDEQEGSYVMVQTDLPINHNSNYHSIIKVKHCDIIDAEQSFDKNKNDTNRKTNRKKSVLGSG